MKLNRRIVTSMKNTTVKAAAAHQGRKNEAREDKICKK